MFFLQNRRLRRVKEFVCFHGVLPNDAFQSFAKSALPVNAWTAVACFDAPNSKDFSLHRGFFRRGFLSLFEAYKCIEVGGRYLGAVGEVGEGDGREWKVGKNVFFVSMTLFYLFILHC